MQFIKKELKNLFSPLMKENLSNMKVYNECQNTYQKVKCYSIDSKKVKSLTKTEDIKIEQSEKMIRLTKKQIFILTNYMNDTLTIYKTGEIHLSEDTLTNFNRVSQAICDGKLVRKSELDFIVEDMARSFLKQGHHSEKEKDFFH
jgi:hypothetical protein